MVMAVFARLRGVDEFDVDVVADAFEVAVAPFLERESGDASAAFFRRTLIRSTAACDSISSGGPNLM